MNWESVIGLEVHAQLLTRSKMFCGCPTAFGGAPNTQTCPVCQGMPGVLPVLNRRALELGIRTALALNCRVNPACRFARKHYYYPDMPKNYQISQYEEPLAGEGWLEIDLEGGTRRIRIERLHLEEDVGKLVHEGTLETAQTSLVDFNRAGVPLMEIVSRPDIRSPEEAAAYLKELRQLLVWLDVCDGNMEEGSLRCDANISVRERGADGLRTKVEIKNLNSFKAVQQSTEYEAERQGRIYATGGTLPQETRLWNPDRSVTVGTRSKEYAHDYRYFPEPDLVPLRLDAARIDEIRRGLPELPRAGRERLIKDHGLPAHDAEVLTRSPAITKYYEATGYALAASPTAAQHKTVSNWIMSVVLSTVSGDDTQAFAETVPPERLAGLLRLVEDGTISGTIAKDVFQKMLATGEDGAAIVVREGLTQVADVGALEALVAQALAASPRIVQDYKSGKTQAAKALVGQVMKASGGRANPALVSRIVEEKLSKM